MSINPALDTWRFCPRCGSEDVVVEFPRHTHCRSCGRHEFHNPKPVASTIPFTADGEVVLLRRGFDPGRGLWTFPGGFVDLGESVEHAAHREAMEELEVRLELTGLVGVYSRPEDRIVLVVFRGRLDEEPRTTPEATEVRAFAPADVPWDELAFWSTRAALQDALGVARD
ncbi:NUDIX domain-containing protein [Conexibacter sp. SYSU D00693]|uniref:NUDIX domain-containing protein n=1 Tax=Conexibacter sp. SYSU D00693 TaxID=2812560 RepID=UPI00196A9B2F|nr:NUDIX domain-containing protein [Conexibacter sp. SYSU D00693]